MQILSFEATYYFEACDDNEWGGYGVSGGREGDYDHGRRGMLRASVRLKKMMVIEVDVNRKDGRDT